MMLKKEIIKIYKDENNNNEDTLFLFDTDQISVDLEKIKKVYSSSKKLILEIISNDSEKFVSIELDPYGYVNSKREKKDGITYFGYQDGDSLVDYQLKNGDSYFNEDIFNGRHFMIKFNPDDLNYYIKDLGKGFGTFIKIQEWTEIKNNLLLNIGENFIVFSLGDEENEEKEKEELNEDNNDIKNENVETDICLNIKIFNMKNQKIFTLSPDNCPATIGRNSDNSIVIDDDMLSRFHCTIDFDKNKWYIQDGYAKNGLQEEEIKKSTNGSWIYAYDEIKITDKMIFKSNHNLFICNLV